MLKTQIGLKRPMFAQTYHQDSGALAYLMISKCANLNCFFYQHMLHACDMLYRKQLKH